MVAVSNTSPIVYLAKVNRTRLLKGVYQQVYVCAPVLNDIEHLHRRGLLTHDETAAIHHARSEQWLILRDPKTPEAMRLNERLAGLGLGSGESRSIALAKELDGIFLANDRVAIEVAKRYDVEARWFTGVLHDALRARLIASIEEYTFLLDLCISKGLYVSRKERDRAIQIAQEML